MMEVRQRIRLLAKKVNPDPSRVAAGPVCANSRGRPASPPTGERSDPATAICDAARRQVLALWWIVRLASDAPEHEITHRVVTLWRQASRSARPSAQRWRHLVNAVEAAVAEPARQTAGLPPGKGMAPQDRAALALILGGHDVAEVAYLEQTSVRDVHRRLRTGLTSLGSILLPTSNT
jgi:hypothetical protein